MKSLIFAITLALSLSANAAKVGDDAPSFKLPNKDGKTVSLEDYKGKYVVLEWLNHGCPYVAKHYDTGNMQELQKDFTKKGVTWLSIISSAPGKQGHMNKKQIQASLKEKKAMPTTVLIDEKGEVGKQYNAKVTPHMYVINPEGKLIYIGAIDDKPTTDKSDVKGATNYVSNALNQAMNNKPVEVSLTKAYGCSIKY